MTEWAIKMIGIRTVWREVTLSRAWYNVMSSKRVSYISLSSNYWEARIITIYRVVSSFCRRTSLLWGYNKLIGTAFSSVARFSFNRLFLLITIFVQRNFAASLYNYIITRYLGLSLSLSWHSSHNRCHRFKFQIRRLVLVKNDFSALTSRDLHIYQISSRYVHHEQYCDWLE